MRIWTFIKFMMILTCLATCPLKDSQNTPGINYSKRVSRFPLLSTETASVLSAKRLFCWPKGRRKYFCRVRHCSLLAVQSGMKCNGRCLHRWSWLRLSLVLFLLLVGAGIKYHRKCLQRTPSQRATQQVWSMLQNGDNRMLLSDQLWAWTLRILQARGLFRDV